MRIAVRLVLIVFVLLSAYVLAQEVAKLKVPALTDQQKLEVRSAQVQLYQAKEILEQTPQFKAFQNAQNRLNETALRVQREIGCTPPKWQFTQELECVAVPEAKTEKK